MARLNVRSTTSEVIVHEAPDGLELEGILVYPHDYQVRHACAGDHEYSGGPEATIRNGWNDRYFEPNLVCRRNKVFATFFPNYRGSTGRGV